MNIPTMPTIPDRPPDQVTLNFAKLLQDGLTTVQRLSHDEWTDYNEHDPGVTMLEALCYGLTDLAYRTDHPIEDILSSSMAATGISLDDQPLFTGNRILTNAPLTENDFRKLAYDNIRGLRNLWLLQVPEAKAGFKGLTRVFVQAYHSRPDGTADDSLLARARLLRRVLCLLQANRNLGQDFSRVEMVGTKEMKLQVSLSVGPDQTPETVIAGMLYRIEAQMNPAPVLRDVGADMDAGMSPERIFEGPPLSHGWIADASLAPLDDALQREAILDIIVQTPGIGDIGRFKIEPVRCTGPETAPHVYMLSRQATDLSAIKVYRDGVHQPLNRNMVLAQWHHLEEQARWHAGYATRSVDELAYASVPQGNPNRQLGRYRSIQYLFPAVYNLAAQGKPLSAMAQYLRDLGPEAANNGARNQLKGYLLFFEQLLADYLEQLNHTSVLLSFSEQSRTYYPQPLVRPGTDDPDAPPEIAPVLGQGTIPPDCGPDTWFKHYRDGIDSISAAQDPVEQRVNRALDALLARFNDSFPDQTLKRVRDDRTKPAEVFEKWLAGQKRLYLRNIVAFTSRRGLGVNLTMPEETAMERTVRAKTGHQGMLAVVEHVLLRDYTNADRIPNLRINVPQSLNVFRIQPDVPVRAVRLGDARFQVHMLLAPNSGEFTWPEIGQRVALLGADPARYRIGPTGGYTVRVQLRDMQGLAADVLEGFASHHQAKAAIAKMAALCAEVVTGRRCLTEVLMPVQVPLDFYQDRVSVFLTGCGDDFASPDYRTMVENAVADQIPAHLDHRCYWLKPCDVANFRKLRANWMAAIAPLAMSPDPSEACKIAANVASRPLRALVQDHFTSATLRQRTHARRVALLQSAGRI